MLLVVTTLGRRENGQQQQSNDFRFWIADFGLALAPLREWSLRIPELKILDFTQPQEQKHK